MKTAHSLGPRLLLQFALVAAVPLIVVACLTWFLMVPQLRAELEIDNQALARSLAGQVVVYLDSARIELETIATLLTSGEDLRSDLRTNLLDAHTGISHAFEAIYLVDGDGMVVDVGLPYSQRNRREDFLGLDLSRREFFIKAISEDRLVWSDTFLSTITGHLAVALAIPAGDMTFIGELTIDRMSDFIRNLLSQTPNLTILMDRQGKTIADSQAITGRYQADLGQVSIVEASRETGMASRRFFLNGQEYYGTVVSAGKMGWMVMTAQPFQEVFRPVKTIILLVGGGLALALVLAMAAGILLSRSLTRAFGRCAGLARSIAGGDYGGKWPESGIREFDGLAADLERMAQAIRERESALAAGEARYRSLVGNAPVATLQFGPDGRVLVCQGKGTAALGLDPEASVGRPVMELLGWWPGAEENIRRSLQGECRQFTTGAGDAYVEMHLIPVTGEGEEPYVLLVAVDLSERKAAEEALKASEAHLREAQELAQMGHFILDYDTGIWRSSEVLDAILGIDAGYTRDRHGFMSLIHPDQRSETGNCLLSGDPEEVSGLDREFRIIRHADGKERWVHWRCKLERDEDGNPVRLIGTIMDLTEKKHLEQQLMQSQKMEAIGHLAGGVAHDFNNMLSVIMGYAELMTLKLPPDDPNLTRVREITRAAEHSRDITRQLLAFSRKQIIEPREVDLNGMIQATAKTLSRLMGEDIEFRFLPAGEIWKLKMDPTQVDQILMNLVVNARDAMPDGGKLTMETGNVSLDEDYCRINLECRPGNHVLLAVSDNGQGMAREALPHIFEPFFTTKAAGKGTGLGLATVYGIVKQNGGFINVYSEPGRGTTFRIYLPRMEGSAGAAEIVREAPPERGTGNVLLVEDEPMVRRTAEEMLRALGYQVVVAETAGEAIAISRREAADIDLLMTDVVMPEMSGKDLAEIIAALRPGLKVLFMSGYTDNVVVHHGVLDEGLNFIQKPLGMAELSRKVHQAMGA